MSDKLYETRHIYLAIGICIAIFSPILLIFVPQTVAQILYYSDDTWYVFTSGENFSVFGAGFFFLFFWDIRKKSIVLSVVCLLLGLFCFVVASLSYKSLSDDSISYRSLLTLEVSTYSWEELDSIIYEENGDDGNATYQLLFTDGNSMSLKNDGHFKAIRYKFYNKLDEINKILETVD
ncbi:hypothetical protein SAMN05216389_101353 [Oceanobacillus limi]|uniref:Uncharacterized protein n=1 Tax=Oceanobacillus limi TaxID=930131 RepID=A0A1H9YEN1_9BACI|nr:hypothetical protein [Oceanobacillus limi]SES67353.1 hypothetical protein SAMN05216389_101353 [Oceanobacillus limi]